MGQIGQDNKVKLFCGIIYGDEKIKAQAFEKLIQKFGEIDLESPTIPFDYTSYYNAEMGSNLKRMWISFKNLIFSGGLADIKIFTNDVEQSFADNSNRTINIDPGYISAANVVLATTKDYSHRIYLDKGIYGEITTIYKKPQGFIKLPWSYPDYMSETARNFLLKARGIFLEDLRLAVR
ncbi:MAG: DUF4416 family protein [Elusimicrobiota bacterium]|jgi:hypothetical protein|nr:DUF4416 family protein [Elusimicrobiota bacterium]